MLSKCSIAAYTFGEDSIPASPVSLEELHRLEAATGWSDDDALWAEDCSRDTGPQAEAIVDSWRSMIGSLPQLAASFVGPDGKPDDHYKSSIRLRFVQWVSDVCLQPRDQKWLDYQEEIGLRHLPARKDRTDNAQTHRVAPQRYLLGFTAVVITTIRRFLVESRAHLLISKASYAAMFKLSPDSWRVREVLGQVDAEAFREEDAIGEFQLAIRAAPHEPGLNEELGDVCWTAGKFQEADDAYSEEIKNDTANAIALYKLGSLRATRGDAAGGVSLLERALALDSTISDAHYYLGKGDVLLGKDDLAIEHFKLATNPQGTEELRMMSWYQLAIRYRNLNRTQEAGEALAAFREMKTARDDRRENKLQEQMRRRDQLPRQETIPATADLL
jgi:hypothetical protein